MVKCILCKEKIIEEYGKMKGTMLKVRDVLGKMGLIYVCKFCQKENGWIEKAKIEGV